MKIFLILLCLLCGCTVMQKKDYGKSVKIYGIGYYQGNFYMGYAHEEIIYCNVDDVDGGLCGK